MSSADFECAEDSAPCNTARQSLALRPGAGIAVSIPQTMGETALVQTLAVTELLGRVWRRSASPRCIDDTQRARSFSDVHAHRFERRARRRGDSPGPGGTPEATSVFSRHRRAAEPR